MVDQDRLLELMEETIREAKKSIAEDSRLHPKVGAILADDDGRILHRAHRGEDGGGGHAEYLLLQKAHQAQTDFDRTVLFITLEPCMQRSPGKIPCAQRILASGIRSVYIGTLDPNPQITGRGETYLSYYLRVDRFPGYLAREIRELNAEFFELHRYNHFPVRSIYAAHAGSELEQPELRPRLVEFREGLLQQSMDMISGSSGGIWIMAGDLSWYRELQISLLLATLDGRDIRIICGPPKLAVEPGFQVYEDAKKSALALGAKIVEIRNPLPLRGTLVEPKMQCASMISVESYPRMHGSLFQMPGDSGLLEGITKLFEDTWDQNPSQVGMSPRIEEITRCDIKDALRAGVPIYRDVPIEIQRVPVDGLLPLAKFLERFKLFRMNQLSVLRMRHSIP